MFVSMPRFLNTSYLSRTRCSSNPFPVSSISSNRKMCTFYSLCSSKSTLVSNKFSKLGSRNSNSFKCNLSFCFTTSYGGRTKHLLNRQPFLEKNCAINPTKCEEFSTSCSVLSNFDNKHTRHKKKSKDSSLITTVLETYSNKRKVEIDKNEWTTVYRFGYIRVARVIQRLKVYQTLFTCCLALPGSLGLYLTGAVPVEHVGFVLGSSIFACAMLYIMGTFCSRLIGVIYVSESNPSLVRVAHLNFWGSREDNYYKKQDFIPFSELPDNVSDIYVNVQFYSEMDHKLHICIRYGAVYDKESFQDIFGTTPELKISEVSSSSINKSQERRNNN